MSKGKRMTKTCKAEHGDLVCVLEPDHGPPVHKAADGTAWGDFELVAQAGFLGDA